ncbi:MAG: nitroreductase [Rikenellaceae bacterium]|nr:nitroreductase [Rikenellaceae bacterium]
MADNYLEKKMEEWRQKPASESRKAAGGLMRLLLKSRSHRGYDPAFRVREDQLQRIIAVNTHIPSARNQQVLRFRPVLAEEAHKVLPHIKLGGALPHLGLPFPGTEPKAFIVICSTIPEDRYVSVDLGIAAQTMLLQAVEIGLNGICIGAFNKEAIRRELELPHEPLLILALGRGTEKILLEEISADDSHAYWRDEKGVHHVPKVKLEELIIT